MQRPFRFGFQLGIEHDGEPLPAARRAEDLGFDIVLVSDHVGRGPSPVPVLGAIAHETSTIGIGTLVVNTDMRNPLHLAWEAATLDRLSGGRFELGLGAGHTPQEYAATGIELHPPAVRKARLAEQVEIVRRLLDGETVDHDGEFHRLTGAELGLRPAHRIPILVGGNGAALLGHAGSHADIIGLQGLGRTHADGHRHDVKWSPAHLDEQLDQIRHGAGDRFDRLELNAMVQAVEVTGDGEAATAAFCARVDGVTPEQVAAVPYVLIGTVDEIVAKLLACRARWGITYYTVRVLDRFQPIIDALRGR